MALFHSQNNIDQRIGTLKTNLTQRHRARQEIAGDRTGRVAFSLVREALGLEYLPDIGVPKILSASCFHRPEIHRQLPATESVVLSPRR